MNEEKSNTMNGYQIRLELLKMSKDLADQEYMMARELIMAPYYSQLGDRKEDGTVEPIPVPAIPDFSVVGDAENVTIVVGDKSNSTSNSFNSIIGETDKTFRINLKIENLKVLPDDYDVAIVSQKIFHMKSANNPVQYWIAVETDSAVGG